MGQRAEELRVEIAETRSDLSDTMDAIGDRLSPGRIAERRKNQVTGTVRSLRERVMGTAGHSAHALTDTAHSATDAVKEAPDMVRQRTEGSPMVAGALAFGVGFLVAATLPQPEREKEAESRLLEKAQPVTQQLTEGGREVVEHVKGEASQAAQELKQTAAEGARSVADTAQQAAQTTKQQASDSAQAVQQQTSESSRTDPSLP
jgi:ElaB/YqjD/DUF883 family membrane-anchored ribosome-binding protein